MNGPDWAFWVAEAEGEVVSTLFVHRIRKIPRPQRLHDSYGYITNVYTKPAYRNRGIGGGLMDHVFSWAKAEDLEHLIVWPRPGSERFYARAGFTSEHPFLEKPLRREGAPPDEL
ncbi:MAG: GNAT family N-acetyltransferase [Armatimonadetes bacterium]|nr:GNAT family N-acetyltransferase [Armatimonadota bacterium]